MAITTSAPNGIIVTTAAVSETAGTQTGTNLLTMSDTFANLNNGNVSGIGYPTRLAMIRRGTGTQEIKYIVSDATNVLTVNEDWDIPPTSGDQIDISYLIQDAATLTGLTLVNKRVADYCW